MSRENRLLLIVVLVSAASLLLLSRFRFPGETRTINPAPAPLERLAARATYDDLASIIVQLQSRIEPALRVLRVHSSGAVEAPALSKLLTPPRRTVGESRLVLAWRLRQNLLLAHLEPADRVDEVVGAPGEMPTLLGIDPIRLVGLVRVKTDDEAPAWQQAAPPATPQYVVVAEATEGGPALRPIFLGRTDPVDDPRWRNPLFALASTSATQPGAMIFTLDGSVAGMVVVQEDRPGMAPASALVAAADDLEHGRTMQVGDIGVQLADMTDALAQATGAPSGAVIAYVRPGSPSDGLLQVGDAITKVGTAVVADAEALRIAIARLSPGAAIALTVVRQGMTSTLNVPVSASPAVLPQEPPAGLGLSLRDTPDAGVEVLRVADNSAAAEAGVAPGDRITTLNGAVDPSARDLARAYSTASAGAHLIVGVTRGDAHLVFAIRKP
jgi:hypothetical protein